MNESYPPLLISDTSGKILQKIYYTHSSLIYNLKWFPFIEILIVVTFVLVGYLAFSNIRRSEESKVWVGMAKEAAHQLGTPLSSMLAWLEILKYSKGNPDSIEETISEMENDISRLNMIATRFSKIGSTPEKREENISESIEKVCGYFEKRLPHLGKRVEIIRNIDQNVFGDINFELFGWVIENLLKNAAEAIESKHGRVEITLTKIPRKYILISVSDNGKGMTKQQKRQIFHPGFTTKKRGWGLGLSLCKRIVEEYHKGKIYVKETVQGKGTTFFIEIPVS
jgi:signal transduction histidine kinase